MYKAKDTVLGKIVAVKVLTRDSISDESSIIQRFQREAKLAANLNHENLVAIFDFGMSEEGLPYLVMEYVEGVTLRAQIEEEPLSLEETVEIFSQIASVMVSAHSNGVIHRDLKTENIILRPDSDGKTKIKVIDFGLAKSVNEDLGKKGLTRTNAIVGSPLFMSPEQAQNENVDERTDIYSLGCIIYACLTGEPPFKGDTAMNTISMHIFDTPKPIGEAMGDEQCPDWLEDIVMKCLAKDADKRYQSMDELVKTLDKELVSEASADLFSDSSETEEKKDKPQKGAGLLLPVAIAFGAIAVFVGGLAFLNTGSSNQAAKPKLSTVTIGAMDTIPPQRSVDKSMNLLEHPKEMEAKVAGVVDDDDAQLYRAGDARLAALLKKEPLREKVKVDLYLSNSGLEALKTVENIRDLRLTECKDLSGDKIVECIKHLPLNRLYLSNSNIDDDNLGKICEIKPIQFLKLDGCSDITNDGLKHLQKLKSLEHVVLKNTNIDDDGMNFIAKLTKLRTLHLENTKVTDEGVKRLAPLKEMRFLSLEGTDIDGSCLPVVSQWKHISRLHLSHTKVTDETVKDLEQIETLQKIELDYCPMLSKRAIVRLRIRLPRCEISAYIK